MSAFILIVEDEKMLQDVYSDILHTAGFDVDTAGSGKEAFDKISQITPDLVLLDLSMPIMDGKALLRKLADIDIRSMKIVVNTNLSDSKTEREVLHLGADKLILKADVGPLELVKLIREMTVV